ncbi:unnamed protein product, partial [marine sediment metagenome]
MAEPWYKNPMPGYAIWDNEDVVILARKRGGDTRQATRQYTEEVIDEIATLREEGWLGYIAPEG